MNNKKTILYILSVLIIALVSITSYAYFTASIGGNATASNTVIVTGYMEVTFENGNVVGTTSNMLPGDYVTLAFSVRNTGTVDTAYDIYLNDVINDFANKSDLVYELISSEGYNINQTTCPETNTKIASNVAIGVGQTHNYTLKITFKETNLNQDNNKGKTFRAKVELSEEVPKIRLATKIIEDKNAGASYLEYDGVDTLGDVGTSDNNLRYVGKFPNNYVYFNCNTSNPDEMSIYTCQKWQIMGIFNNIEDGEGNADSRVKIIHSGYLGLYSWDSSIKAVNQGTGVNQWGESVYEDGTLYPGSFLMRELNTDYLGNYTIGADGYWVGDYYNRRTVKRPTSTIKSNALNMIQEAKWYTGSKGYSTLSFNPKNMYNLERSENNGKYCSGGVDCSDTVVRTSSWVGKIGLMSVSEFGYSTSGSDNYDKRTCLETDFSLWSYRYTFCGSSSWLYGVGNEYNYITLFTITASGTSNSANTVYCLSSSGDITERMLFEKNGVRPALYLKNDVYVLEGDGSYDNPYKLAI
ncbi:MAG: hypothetical protein E7159_02145 [Firmicutes bacterium]|nr:hypothetical protein [Bacillota bacterium]